MHGYWTFEMTVAGVGGQPRRSLIVFCATETPDDVGVAECVEAYCNEHRPPDRIYLIAPRPQGDALQRVLVSDRFTGRVQDVTRYIDTPGAEVLLFDETGDLRDAAGNAPPAGLADAIRRRGLTHLVRSYPVMRLAPPSYHFVLPSGDHAPYFFRIGSALADGAAIDFLAFCCLRYIPRDVRNVYCDSGTIIPVAYAISALRKRFDPEIPAACIRSFRSYEGVRTFEFRDMARSVILLSLTITGGLPSRIKSVHTTIPNDTIVSLFALRSLPEFPNVVCDLRQHQRDNPAGFESFETYTEERCPLCASGSTCIPIAGEQFLAGHTRVEPLMLRAAHSPAWLSPFLEAVVGKRLIHANYRSHDTGHATREVFFDLEQLFRDEHLLGVGRFHRRLQWALARAIPASLTRIVHLDSPASKVMAERIAEGIRPQFPGGVTVHRYSDIRDHWREHVTETGATLVVAAAAASGRSMLSVAQLLRRIQKNGAITYLVGLARYPSQDIAVEIESNITYGEQPRDYGYFAVERVFLPLVGSRAQTTWDLELDLINDLLRDCEPDARAILEVRSATIRGAADHAVRGMVDDLFWSKPNGEAMQLRRGFAFFNFEPPPETRVSQADVFFTIVAILHALRSAREARESLFPHEHLRRVLSPRCFDRFNDGVIQSSLLRAATRLELDYATDENLSNEMWQFLDFTFRERTNDPGEACREFLLALALGRLRLRPEDTRRLREAHGDASPDPVERLLWERVGTLLAPPAKPEPDEAPPVPQVAPETDK
jgi:hypothetical protein